MLDTDLYQLTKEILASIMADGPFKTMAIDSGRRRVPRLPYLAPLNISQELTPGSERQFRVTAKDISLGGVGIICVIELQMNERVIIVLEHEGITLAGCARVVNCQQNESGYRIGLVWEFD